MVMLLLMLTFSHLFKFLDYFRHKSKTFQTPYSQKLLNGEI